MDMDSKKDILSDKKETIHSMNLSVWKSQKPLKSHSLSPIIVLCSKWQNDTTIVKIFEILLQVSRRTYEKAGEFMQLSCTKQCCVENTEYFS